MDLPKTQKAVQLVGPDKLILNESKELPKPGRYQILCRVEAVGLCFSDLKLLKQFSSHVRKSEIVSGIELDVLKEIPSYVPGEAPTVPGHEAVVRIEAVGPDVDDFEPGQRYLVQTDYRWLRTTTGSNAAFGYNIEGGLAEYTLMDKRVITSPDGDSMLLPVSEELSGSAVALVEPWACVEDAYASTERREIKKDGQMLVVADADISEDSLVDLFESYGKSAEVKWVSDSQLSEIGDSAYDDIIYFGSSPEMVEGLFTKLAGGGLLNIVLCGGKFGRDVVTMVGRVHYGGIRIIGTTGSNPAESMETVPETGEIRPGDKINVIGAGGPMGLMHVVRNICQGVEGVSVYGSDVDDDRLATLSKIAMPLAEQNNVEYKSYNPTKGKSVTGFDYTALMAPIPALVAASVKEAATGGIINIFAGIPATVTGEIDLDCYIEKRLYFIGTSGSTLEDMKRMLSKVESGRLDTNLSVAAISGLAGATEGIRAVENRLVAGKIVVYPACEGLGLVRLEQLNEKLPEVAKLLDNGFWTVEAERALLKKFVV